MVDVRTERDFIQSSDICPGARGIHMTLWRTTKRGLDRLAALGNFATVTLSIRVTLAAANHDRIRPVGSQIFV